MYPRTIFFIVKTVEDIYIAKKLSTITIQVNKTIVDTDKTRIIFMFDGGYRSVYTEAYRIMRKYGYKGSISVIPSLVGEREYMSYKQLAELYVEGWDLLNLSYSHKDNMYDNPNKLLLDFNKGRQWMINRYIGKYSDMLVIPYGDINPYLIKLLKEAGYRNARTSENIIVLEEEEIEYYPVITVSLLTNVTVTEVKEILKKTFNETQTVIFILNKIGNRDNGIGMTYSRDKLEQIITFINENSDKLQVITYSQLF
jgi:peptidoglycan/xylan/chitin deacetylase (PgdA/CDA1 family)